MRRSIFILAIFLSFSVFSEGLQVITSNGLQGVADDRGNILIPPIYELLGWSDGSNNIVKETIGYKERGKWGLISVSDKKITAPRYSLLKPLGNEYFQAAVIGRFSNATLRGVIDRKANTIIDFRYFTIDILEEDRIVVSEYKDQQFLYGLYTIENERVLSVKYSSITKVGELYLAQSTINHKYKIFDRFGRAMLPVWVDEVDWYYDQYLVRNDGKVGLLSENGQLLQSIEYKEIDSSGNVISFPTWEVRAIDSELNSSEYINCDSITFREDGQILIAYLNDVTHILGATTALFSDQQYELKYVGEGFLIAKNVVENLWGVYQTNGVEVIYGYDSIQADKGFFYAKNQKGLWDIFDPFGNKINNFAYQAVGFSDSQNNISVKKNGYWGWIDFEGNQLINHKFDDVRGLEADKQFLAKYINKWGVATVSGDWVVMAEYDSIITTSHYYIGKKGLASHIFTPEDSLVARIPFQVIDDGFLKLKQDSLYGLITSEGLVINPEYDSVGYVDGYYKLIVDNRMGLIDPKGNIIIHPKDEIDDVIAYSEGYFLILKNGKYGFVDENGKLRVANRYDAASPFEEGLAPVSLLGKWGYINKAEKLVIQPYYKYSTNFKEGYAIIQSGSNYGLIDQKGNEIIEAKWKEIKRLETGNYLITDWDSKYGLSNPLGEFIIRPSFDLIIDTDKKLVIVSRGGKKGVLNYEGFSKVPIAYKDVKIVGDYLLLLKGQ